MNLKNEFSFPVVTSMVVSSSMPSVSGELMYTMKCVVKQDCRRYIHFIVVAHHIIYIECNDSSYTLTNDRVF